MECVDEVTVVAPGINGKMSEINSAFGLLQLKHIDQALERRAEIDSMYRSEFKGVTGIHCIASAGQAVANYAYFPVLVEDSFPLSRDELYEMMKRDGVYARRYFYPLISDFPMYRALRSAERSNLPVAASAADRVLCLPIYPALQPDEQKRVIDLIRGV